MESRTTSIVAAVAVLLVAIAAGAAALGAGGVLAQAEQPDRPSDRTITVTGQGSAEAPPDEAVVSVAVVAEGDDPAAVRDDLAAGTAALRGALANASVSDDAVETEEFFVRERRRHADEDEPDDPAYRGVHAFRVPLDDVDSTGAAVDAAAAAGAQVRFVAFTLSDERRTEARDDALTDAMADARQQATTLADAGDLQVTEVRRIDASERHGGPVVQEAAAEDVGGETTVRPGDVRVSVQVHVTYDADPVAESDGAGGATDRS